MKKITTLFAGLFLISSSHVFAQAAPVTNFKVSATSVCKGQTVQYTDLSQNNPTSWNWIFRNGTPATSTLQNPVVVYNTSGRYDAILMASNAQGTLTLGKLSVVEVMDCSGLSEFFGDSPVNVFPNPAQNSINVFIHSDAKFTLFNAIGSVMVQGYIKDEETTKISLENFAPGVYFLNLQKGAIMKSIKVIKE